MLQLSEKIVENKVMRSQGPCELVPPIEDTDKVDVSTLCSCPLQVQSLVGKCLR